MDIWFKEQEPYTRDRIKELVIGNAEEENKDFDEFFRYLMGNKILKKKGKDITDEDKEDEDKEDLLEDDPEDFESNTQKYAFYYVGVVIWKQFSVKCYPKYISNTESIDEKFPLIIKVIEKYKNEIRKGKKKEEPNYSFYEAGEKIQINRLELALQLLNNYYENGIYSNTKTLYEINGSGDIDWDRTVNQSVAYVFDEVPMYIDSVTSRQISSNSNYIYHLHEFILSQCTKDLIKADLINAFDIDEVNLSDKEKDEFGDIDFILYKIQSEYQVQFVTWKQDVLRLMYTYMREYRASEAEFDRYFYGTKFFHTIWEDVCKKVLSNTLDETVESILQIFEANTEIEHYRNMEISVYEKDENSQRMKLSTKKYLETKLINLIRCPRWIREDSEAYAATLIPDLISINNYLGKRCFSILDAKYYNIEISGTSVKNNPGVGDVTKQYLYQLAYNPFIEEHNFFYIQNLFLCPGEAHDTEYGRVEMDIFNYCEGIQLECIHVVKLPADAVYEKYISGTVIKDKEFFEIIPKPSEVRINRENGMINRVLRYAQGLILIQSIRDLDLNRRAIFVEVIELIKLESVLISGDDKEKLLSLIKGFSRETIERSLCDLYNQLCGLGVWDESQQSEENENWLRLRHSIYEIYGIEDSGF